MDKQLTMAKKKSKITFDQSVLFVDDERRVRETIERDAKKHGFINIKVVATVSDALKCLENKQFDIISCDYNMEGQQLDGDLIDGIGFFKYIKGNYDSPLLRILYSGYDQSEIKKSNQFQWCVDEGIIVLTKPNNSDHSELFNTIKKLTTINHNLPTNPEFAFLEDTDFLKLLASELIQELKTEMHEPFSFGSDTIPIDNQKLIEEVAALTPLGKEILGNWFRGMRLHLNYLHNKQINQTRHDTKK